MLGYEVHCPRCDWSRLLARTDLVAWLRGQGCLRRSKEAEDFLIEQLFRARQARMVCEECGAAGLQFVPADVDDQAWNTARKCSVCGQTIPSERLKALPGADRCVRCQSSDESGTISPEDVSYCPRCGCALKTRLRSTGATAAYEEYCAECGWK